MKRVIPLLLSILIVVGVGLSASKLLTAPPAKPVAPQRAQVVAGTMIKVAKGELSFAPATCARGSAGFGWGLGSVSVEVLGRENDHCVFDFTNEIEGGYDVYRCRIPVTTKQVRVYVDNGDISTSFDLKQGKIIGGGNLLMDQPAKNVRKWTGQSVTGTSYVNYISPLTGGKAAGAKKGDHVKVRLTLLASDMKTPWIGVKPLELSFILGAGDVDPGIAAAAEGMKPGGVMLAKIRNEVLPGIAKKIGGLQSQTQVVMKIELTAVK